MGAPIAEAKGALIGEGRATEIYAWGADQPLKLYHAERLASWVGHEAGAAPAGTRGAPAGVNRERVGM